MKFEQKLNKLIDKKKLTAKDGRKLYRLYSNDVMELQWALRVALDRYDWTRVNKAEEILAKYEDFK